MTVYIVSKYGDGWLPMAVCESKEKAEEIITCYKEFLYSDVRIEEYETDRPIEDYYNIYLFAITPSGLQCNPIYEYIEGRDKPIGELFGYGNFKRLYLKAPIGIEAVKKGDNILSEYIEKSHVDGNTCHYYDDYDIAKTCYYIKKNGEWVKE